MKLTLHGHDDRYAVEQLQLSLFPGNTEGEAVSSLHRGKVWLTAVTKITVNGVTATATRRIKAADETVRLRRRALQQSYYLAAKQLLPVTPTWGALAGVRPTKITTKHLLEGGTPKSADELLRDVYYVTDDRRRLAVDCSVSTVRAVNMLQPSDLSLYVGIPFCPTRCAYCSFVSQSVERSFSLVEPYVKALIAEIRSGGDMVRSNRLRPRAFYMGGGTPGILTPDQMDAILTALEESFDLSACPEITVEIGRPDTITAEKLAVLKSHGVTRVCVNPQTMEDHVLAAIGRRHVSADTVRAMELVRAYRFPHVNMDLIAGLPADTPEGFRRSLDKCLELGADDITIHTLALKKGSRILMEGLSIPDGAAVQAMLDYAAPTLRAAGFVPYYLYRQKYMSGSFENVGWSRPGGECWYNVDIMSELCSILSFGAGGSTKMVEPGTNHIERVFNLKYPKEYTERPEKIQQNQAAFAEFYQKYVPET